MGFMSSKDYIDTMKSDVNRVINQYIDIMNRDGLFYNDTSPERVCVVSAYVNYIDLIDKNDILKGIITDPFFLGDMQRLQHLGALDDMETKSIKTIVNDAYKRKIIDQDHISMSFTDTT